MSKYRYPDEGTRVRVYYNLHLHTWSVQDVKSGLVVCHSDNVDLYDCTFVVRPAGRQKVRDTGRKNVHAFVVGTWSKFPVGESETSGDPTYVTYNPYANDTFVTAGIVTKRVTSADEVVMTPDRKVLAFGVD